MIRPQWQILEETKPKSHQEILDVLLRNRGVRSSFLNGALKDLESHLDLQGMNEGAELMAKHVLAGHKIVLVGDYDCDGVTSLAQMSLFLREIGHCNHEVVIPLRAEGYGFPKRAVVDHPDARLFVAMDCGTMDVEPLTLARARGADTVVIDHHEVSDTARAPATVLINPKQPACPSAFKDFCSSGLTLLFLARLRRELHRSRETPNLGGKYLILAAIGTVADLVPLVDGNRVLTRYGLSSLNTGRYIPVQEIAHAAGLSGKNLTAGHLGYYVGPRINAAGRMGDARIAFDLLVAEDREEMKHLALELNRLNARRQHQEDAILREIRERYALRREEKRALIMGDPKWPSGIIGIVASRVQQEVHYGPTIVFSVEEAKGIARGSARSVPGFDIHAALRCCDNLLLKWGGHKMAAGITLSIERLESFVDRFEEVAREHPGEIFVPKGKIDMELDPTLVSRELLDVLKQLEPYGLGNPTPVFAARKVRIAIQRRFGKDRNHLHLSLGNGIEGVFWRGGTHYLSGLQKDNNLQDVVYQVEWNDYRRKAILNIKDVGHLFQ